MGHPRKGCPFLLVVGRYPVDSFDRKRGMEIGTNAVQLLGGYGFCRDYPVERWYRDLRAVAVSYNGMHL